MPVQMCAQKYQLSTPFCYAHQGEVSLAYHTIHVAMDVAPAIFVIRKLTVLFLV